MSGQKHLDNRSRIDYGNSMTSTQTLTPLELDQEQMADAVCTLIARYRCTLPDGRELRLVVERQDGNPMDEINGMEALGRVAWVHKDRDTGRDAPRPAGFDGDAVKLSCSGYALEGKVWWQPLFEVWGLERSVWHADAELRNKEIGNIKRLLEDGFQQVGVKLYETLTDSLGHAHTVKVAESWLAGIDSVDDDEYMVEVVTERIQELS